MTTLWKWFMASLRASWFLWTMIIVNGLGSIYGFIWYAYQLESTSPAFLRLFVPDSPTASTLFTLVLIALLAGRSIPSLEAFAAVLNFKYGVWAVAVIIAGAALGDELNWQHYMLMFSHGGMALESLLYARFYTLKMGHIFWVAAWTLLNDLLDYTLDIHPWLADELEPYDQIVGFATFGLSLFSLWLIYTLVQYHRRFAR
ncbi:MULTISPECIES: DUF1405 domain-containing protein [Aneurinibacillus]|uniref:DUF1405 domain-containing protein n=1 Tax=Aneurinibacillus thermoaerophilus TaxID=143495 RepID=A0A1G8BTB4_ANETH|nr:MULTISPECIES: DUF1405 domain-containing protein [Aneurinibacillus]AMA73551.1 hypothetical protein ACH33_12245 [Aneurinibacillus sp. XH2]MED0674939.1 DUF1405 domain-containing protein [Aneurinibacillus thermoaerophilus]MED0679660.1 DUF1405 domain-containing protein [Aneurinibacillus thermoaerophilus]MED0737342.1 DUF1405 domain-containing protein [Aneurinibacillus thermoaerophilus]MED0756191.1 DUF1405 domain-containing protein [Aneurinibacillus thermoaerophilus]